MYKKTFKTLLIIIVTILFCSVPVQSVTKTGTTSAKFLSIGIGSRANGMGNAFVAIANDATAMYWNPAGISQMRKIELAVNYTHWLVDMELSYVGIVFPLQQYGSIGLNSTYMNMGKMDVTTERYPEGTGETFTSGSYTLGLSYAKRLTDRFLIGANLKYISEFIMNCDANAVAIDIGTLFVTPFKDIRFGVSISNFGNKMQMTGDDLLVQKDIDEQHCGNNESVNAYLATEEFDLPLLLRVGFSGDFSFGNALSGTWAVDAAHPNDNTEYINLGMEIGLLNNLIMLRGGMKSLLLENRDEKLSFGVGFNFNVSKSILHFDYAYQSFLRLGLVHKYTIRLSF